MGLLKDTTASVLGNTADVLDDTAKAIESDGKTETSAAAPASDDTAAKANTTTSASQEGATTSASNGETVPSGTPSEISARISLTDGKHIREAFYMKIPAMFPQTELLSSLRKLIAGTTDQKEFVSLDFCSKKGAIVPDDYSIKDYLQQCLEDESPKEGTIDLYLKKVFVETKKDEARLSDVVNVSRLAELKHKFDETGFKLLTGTYWKYPAELEEKEWASIAENNSLCYGLRIVRRKMDGKTVVAGIERARFPAFRLKQRDIVSDRLASSTARDVVLYLRIPDYIVDDKSYVSIYETTTALQASLATSSFSEFDVSASASGGFFGCSLSASASYGESSSNSFASSSSSSGKQLTIAYNFPRVTIFLDNRSLELTTQAQAALDRIHEKADLTEFLENYGEFFATRVQLGGRLFATESVDTSSSASVDKIKNSMRAAASVSFSGFGAAASVSTSGQSASANSASSSTTESTTALTWQANGGDSLLCNKPSEWCATVADFNQWRITQQDEGLHLVDFVGKFRGYENLPERMTEWNKDSIPKHSVKIYLNGLEGYPHGRFLTADPGRYSEMNALSAFYARGGIGRGYSRHLSLTPVGFLGPTQKRREVKFLEWKVEDADGHHVDPVCYGTPYRLKSPEHGYLTRNRNFVTVSPTKGAFVRFFSSDNQGKEGPIANEGLVNVQFTNSIDLNQQDTFNFMYIAGKDDDNEYLGVTGSWLSVADDKPIVLVFRIAT